MDESDHTDEWVQQGLNASETDVVRLLDKIRASRNDLESRCKLIGHLCNRWDKNSRARLSRHVMHLILHHPNSKLAGSPFCRLHQGIDPGYRKCRDIWNGHVAKRNASAAILFNASRFLAIHDSEFSIKLLQRLVRREPDSARWHISLGNAYLLRVSEAKKSGKSLARRALKHFEIAYKLAVGADDKFYLLDDLTKAAFQCGSLAKAAGYATELLTAARKQRANWNYGNAIHHGNTYLGRIALLDGKLKNALLHLRASLKHKGSPQLNSFGPPMELAQEILAAGSTDAVLDYLKGCKAFWKHDCGALDLWRDEIRRTGFCTFNLAEVMGNVHLGNAK